MFGSDFAAALKKGLMKGRKEEQKKADQEKQAVPAAQAAANIGGGKTGYFYATQDGAAILLNGVTPNNILGLFTERLKTCIAIFVFGSKGMALIHDTGMLKVESMDNIFSLLGDITSCTIAYDPDYPGQQESIGRIVLLLKKYNLDKKYKTIETLSGQAWASKESNEVFNTPMLTKDGIQPLHMEVRHWINIVNNFFLKSDQRMEPDIQLYGASVMEVPRLIKSPDDIKNEHEYHRKKVIKLQRNAEYLEKMLRIHDLFWKELSLDFKEGYADVAIRKSEFQKVGMQNLDDLEIWLRKQDERRSEGRLKMSPPATAAAASAGVQPNSNPQQDDVGARLRKASAGQIKLSTAEYKILLNEAKDAKAINNPSTNGKTALHWAAFKGEKEFAILLLDAKADVTKKDNDGKMAIDYAKDEEMKKLFDAKNSAAAPAAPQPTPAPASVMAPAMPS